MVALLRVLGQPLPVLNAQGPSAKVWRPWRALPTEVQDAPMRSVEADAACVEQRLLSADYACPVCEGELRPWGFARWRIVGRGDELVRLRPRRSRCKACRLTHVLLPVACLLRRCDLAEMIGRGLALKVAGWGYRRIAASLGIPASTVGDRGRRFEKMAGHLRVWFTALLYFLDPSFGAIPPVPPPGPSGRHPCGTSPREPPRGGCSPTRTRAFRPPSWPADDRRAGGPAVGWPRGGAWTTRAGTSPCTATF